MAGGTASNEESSDEMKNLKKITIGGAESKRKGDNLWKFVRCGGGGYSHLISVTFSDFFLSPSWLSPKCPFTCQTFNFICYSYLILSYHTPSSFILSLKIIAHNLYQKGGLYPSLSILGHLEHRGHHILGPEDTSVPPGP